MISPNIRPEPQLEEIRDLEGGQSSHSSPQDQLANGNHKKKFSTPLLMTLAAGLLLVVGAVCAAAANLNRGEAPKLLLPQHHHHHSSTSTTTTTTARSLSDSLQVDLECIPPEGYDTCEGMLPPFVNLCQETSSPPTELFLQYTPRACPSFPGSVPNIKQPYDALLEPSFLCVDHPQLQADDEDGAVWIVATDAMDDTIVYHEGLVEPEGTFRLLNHGTYLGHDMKIILYSNQDKAVALQTMILQDVCSSSHSALHLGARFASLLVVGADLENGVLVDTHADVTLKITTHLSAHADDAISLVSLGCVVNPSVGVFALDFGGEDEDVMLQPGETRIVDKTLSLNLLKDQRHTALCTLVGEDETTGDRVADSAFLSFRAGVTVEDDNIVAPSSMSGVGTVVAKVLNALP